VFWLALTDRVGFCYAHLSNEGSSAHQTIPEEGKYAVGATLLVLTTLKLTWLQAALRGKLDRGELETVIRKTAALTVGPHGGRVKRRFFVCSH
jgi:hypothetical protein